LLGEADAAQGGGRRRAGGARRQARGLREMRRGEGACHGGAPLQDSRGMRGVRWPRTDGADAGEDNPEDIASRDGVRGRSVAVAVLRIGAVPARGGDGGGVDSASASGAERLHGESQEEGPDVAEASSGFVAARLHRKF